MLLKSIEMKNFRPFREPKKIEFSTDPEKNVTIIIAKNGVGKTTLAQAFQWVLYGQWVSYGKEKAKKYTIINVKEYSSLQIGESAEVEVKLELVHLGREYTITRTQKFYKETNDNPRKEASKLKISYKAEDGQTEFIDEEDRITTIKKILPEELLKYFFFNGELINSMSDDIEQSSEFPQAVENLLGLKPLKEAIVHMNPKSKFSVIGKFDEQIDANGDRQLKEFSNEIYKLEERIITSENRISEIQQLMGEYNNKKDELTENIRKFSEVEKMQERLDKIERDIELDKKTREDKIKYFLNAFVDNACLVLQRKLVQDAIVELSEADKLDSGIPFIRDETIKHILRNKRCICGADLSDDESYAVKHLLEQLKVVPPIAIGGSIKRFVDLSRDKIERSDSSFYSLEGLYKDIKIYDKNIQEKEDEIDKIDKSMLENNKVAEYKMRLQDYKRQIEKLEEEKYKLVEQNAIDKKSVNEITSQRDKLILVSKNNEELQMYRQYAISVYTCIEQLYRTSEKTTKEEVQAAINDMFKRIFSSGVSIEIDEKYHMKINIEKLEKEKIDMAYSTSQTSSVIFAFIFGIIDLAKKRMKKSNEHLVETDEYPIVMDAPLSVFDETRVKNICNLVPKVARQVIMILQDKDGKLAKERLVNSIGKEYSMIAREYGENDEIVLDTAIIEGSEV